MNPIEAFKFLIDTDLSELRDIQKTRSDLRRSQDRIADLEQYVRELKSNKYTVEIDKDRDKIQHSIDFDNYPVFSVERVDVGTTNEKTIIGYKKTQGESENCKFGEWALYCSRDNHNKLYVEFENLKEERKENDS